MRGRFLVALLMCVVTAVLTACSAESNSVQNEIAKPNQESVVTDVSSEDSGEEFVPTEEIKVSAESETQEPEVKEPEMQNEEATAQPTAQPTEQPTEQPEVQGPVVQEPEQKEEANIPTEMPEVHIHEYVGTMMKASSCSEEGLMKYDCRCGDTYEEIIGVIAHSFGEYIYNEDATYLMNGTKTATCTVCGTEDTKTADGTKKQYTYEEFDRINMVVNGDATLYDMPAADGEPVGELSRYCIVTVIARCNETGWYKVENVRGQSVEIPDMAYISSGDLYDFRMEYQEMSRIDMYSTREAFGWAGPSVNTWKVFTVEIAGDWLRTYGKSKETGWYFVQYGDDTYGFMEPGTLTEESPYRYTEDGIRFFFDRVSEAPYLVDYRTGEPTTYDNVWFETNEYGATIACALYGGDVGYEQADELIKKRVEEIYGPVYRNWEPVFCFYEFLYHLRKENGESNGIFKHKVQVNLLIPEMEEPFPYEEYTLIEEEMGACYYYKYKEADAQKIAELDKRAEEITMTQCMALVDAGHSHVSFDEFEERIWYTDGLVYKKGYRNTVYPDGN